MVSPRWSKLLRDARASRGRLALMITAIAVSLAGVGAVLGGFAILTREIRANYLGTQPAAATLALEDGVDRALVEAVAARPGIAAVEAREVVEARARTGDGWQRLLLFVEDGERPLRLDTYRLEHGAWPPPEGTMLVERSAVRVLGAGLGAAVTVKTPQGSAVEVPISGVVHDPGLAPAWQERSGYGFVTRATLGRLGEPPVLHELRVRFAGDPRDPAEIEVRATALARWLREQGRTVHELRVPPPLQHPHERQMKTVLVMLLAFSGLALILSSVLVATSLDALLTRQVREIAIMKTLGARRGQVAGLYAALVVALGGAALLFAAPLGLLAAHGLAGAISGLLNLELTSTAIPAWVFLVQLAAGLGVPLLVSSLPIARAARRTIRAAIDDHGTSTDRLRGWASHLPRPLRDALRRPARLALTLGLLAAGGAMALTAAQVKKGWEKTVAKAFQTRHYGLEVVLHRPAPHDLLDRLGRLPGIRGVEGWGWSPAGFTRPDGFELSHAYPDRGHGAFTLAGVPQGSTLVDFPVLAGRWLRPGDEGTDAVVLNHGAMAQAPGLSVGDAVHLSIDGKATVWRLLGVVEEIGSPGAAYVDLRSFQRATGTAGAAQLLRARTAPGAEAAALREVGRALEAEGLPVRSALTLADLGQALDEHVLVLARLLLAMAVILGIVGILGLVSTMGISVVERTRELAILKTLGATPRLLRRRLLAEALCIAGLSYVAAALGSLPLTVLLDGVAGRAGFLAPLPLVLAPGAAAVWLAVVAVATSLATLVPARSAARIVIREALERT